jgi:predicted O-linked N-acetylglucosamine transferase (SPINDLY family)
MPARAAKDGTAQRAVALHRSGKLDEAEKLYRSVLAASPGDVDATHLLGVLLCGKRQFDEGLRLIRRAIELTPTFAPMHNNLGTALLAAKRAADAVLSFKRAIELKPDFAEAHSNLGNALAQLERSQEAAESHERAIALKPDYAEGHNNLASALIDLGRHNDAAAAARRALALRPNYAKAHNNLAAALAALHRPEEAIESYRRATEINPDFAEAHRGLGNALLAARRPEEATAAFRRAIAIRTDYAEAHNDLGSALSALRQMAAAAASHRRAIELMPDNGEAHNNLGNALLAAGQLEEAAAAYRRAAELMPGDCNALVQYVHVTSRMCAWREMAPAAQELVQRAWQPSYNGPSFPLLPLVDDPALALAAAQSYVRHNIPNGLPPLWKGERYDHPRIRLAYYSFDFREHPAGRLIVELIERHDRAQFEVYGIAFGPDDRSALRRRIAQACDHFIDVRELTDEAIAQKLRALEIDILVDLTGHTEGSRSRALAWRPAPAQAAYIGYPATMGAQFIDYAIADRFVAPFEHQPYFTEKLVHLPDCFQASDTRRTTPGTVQPRSAYGLPEDAFVFCCFNNTYKITPEFFDAWMRLLEALPGSVLWLVGDNRWAEANLKAQARERGVEPARLIFAPRVDYPTHLARQHVADLFLDTGPYNGGATTNDALWCGLPVLTCSGRNFPSRMGGSLLLAIGLPELVTHTLADYEARALELARQPDRMKAVRNTLAVNRSQAPLFDTDRFRRHLEAAYGEMWRITRDGETPSSFSIEPAE